VIRVQEGVRTAAPIEGFDQLVRTLAFAMEAAGIAVIVAGSAGAIVFYLQRSLRGHDAREAYHRFRAQLGRAILLGLEFLVGADIIRTVVMQPSFHNFGVLGLLILIRTFLSFTLEVEIDGHWPWEASRNREASSKPESL
jgi:uncharacterized membrane protein